MSFQLLSILETPCKKSFHKTFSYSWILDLEDIEKNTGTTTKRVFKNERNTASTKHIFQKNMVLYGKLRPYLNKVILADRDGYCTSEIIPLDFADIIHPRYAQLFLMSSFFVEYTNHCSYGMKMPRLGTKDGQCAYFVIPPYNEQLRIIDKINLIFEQLQFIKDSICN